MGSKFNWFEIPVANMERAVKFYREVFQQEMQVFQPDDTRSIALMPPGAGKNERIAPQGTLLQVAGFEPRRSGSLVYFDPVQSIETMLERVETADGKFAFPKFRIGNGYLATFIDGEGNTVGLLAWDQ